MKKPADLAYGVDERPPWPIAGGAALQHIGLISIYLLFPLVVGREAGAPADVLGATISLSMLALALATVLQCGRFGPVGSGYLCPMTFTAAYLGPSLVAARLGGLPLVWGMTFLAGAFEALLSRGLTRLRALLPTEISGLVVFLVGLTNGTVGVRYLLTPGEGGGGGVAGAWHVGAVCLAVTVGLNVWSRGHLRTFCLLIGMTLGYLLALWEGAVAPPGEVVAGLPVLALPSLAHLGWGFDATLAPAFAIAAVAAALKVAAMVALCQKLNDAEWRRPRMASIRRGVLADGLGTMAAGSLGALGTNISSPNVGLASATGVASRAVGFVISGLLLLLALTPPLAQLLTTLPRPLIGAGLVFVACFVLLNGMQIITSRMLDVRRSVVVGVAVLVALAIEILPGVVAELPLWAQPMFGSSLVAGTAVALALNLVFRIGVRRTATFVVEPEAHDAEEMDGRIERQGGTWAARPEVIVRARFAVAQLVEALIEHGIARGPITVAMSFDEFQLDVVVTYAGDMLPLPDERPGQREIIESEDAMLRLTGFLLKRNADRVRSEARDGGAVIRFTFEH